MRQESVLLALVEAMNLVDEDDRPPALRLHAASARSTASRMSSLTPPSTADMAMNWAIESLGHQPRQGRLALCRAGPHRIIECSRPDSKATRKGFRVRAGAASR